MYLSFFPILRCSLIGIVVVRLVLLADLGKVPDLLFSEQCQQRTATGISTEIPLIGHRPFGNSHRTSTPASLFHEAYCRWATTIHVRMTHIRQRPYLAVVYQDLTN